MVKLVRWVHHARRLWAREAWVESHRQPHVPGLQFVARAPGFHLAADGSERLTCGDTTARDGRCRCQTVRYRELGDAGTGLSDTALGLLGGLMTRTRSLISETSVSDSSMLSVSVIAVWGSVNSAHSLNLSCSSSRVKGRSGPPR